MNKISILYFKEEKKLTFLYFLNRECLRIWRKLTQRVTKTIINHLVIKAKQEQISRGGKKLKEKIQIRKEEKKKKLNSFIT